MSSIAIQKALEHESDKDAEKGIRDVVDKDILEKESVRVKS